MAFFNFSATAVDGKNTGDKGSVEAADKQDAEKQVKAKFTYPVKVVLNEVPVLGVLDIASITQQLEGKWDIASAPSVAAAGSSTEPRTKS